MKKGQQMSLEMIIGLVILLVVAGIVIGLIFQFLTPSKMRGMEKEAETTQFITKCRTLCTEEASLEYCKYYFEGRDWDKDGLENELVKVGKIIEWDACEDRIYCFLAVPCPRFGDNPIEGCARELCSAYYRKYGNLTLASKIVADLITESADPGCKARFKSLPSYDNWKTLYFNYSYGNKTLCEYWIG